MKRSAQSAIPLKRFPSEKLISGICPAVINCREHSSSWGDADFGVHKRCKVGPVVTTLSNLGGGNLRFEKQKCAEE